MLTISAPIEIKAKSTYLKDPEAFYHRIIGNYSLMETSLSREDLLHVTATPPEIYVSEAEGMTSILSRNERNETNINKVDILNNVMNRIVVSADANLTYQDRVFITDALYRLGIRDDRRFMENFYQIAQETRNTNTLINLYLERGERLREVVESIEQSQQRILESQTTTTERERENYLYNSILERLKTGAVYQIVSNFNRTVEDNEIDQNEYSLSNQTYTAQHILLSVLRERAGVSTQNLVFLNNNTYEESLLNEETNLTSVKNEMTSAVLMDLLKNIYHTAYDRFYAGDEVYYRFEDTFYGASDQTFVRLLNNLQTDFAQNREISQYVTNMVQAGRVDMIYPEIPEEGELTEEEIQRISEIIRTSDITGGEILREQVSEILRQTERSTLESERVKFTERQLELLRKVEEGTATQEEIRRVRELVRTTDTSIRKTISEQVSQLRKETEIRNLYNETGRFTTTELELLRKVEEGTATEEEIKRVREIVSYSGIRNEERIRNILEQTSQSTEIRDIYNENNALTSTEIELLEKGEEETMTEEEIKRITETVNRMNIQNERRRQRYVREIQKIRQAEPAPGAEKGGFERTKKDAVLALTNPQKLMEELTHRSEVRAIRQNNIINEIQSIFPDQSMEVYQILTRLKEGDVSIIENNIARPAELGELIYDVNMATEPSEEERRARIKAEREQAEIEKAIKSAREQEKASSLRRQKDRSPAQTIHRSTETLTTEELNEQLNQMQNNISRQMNKTVQSDVVTENKVVNTTQVVTNETQKNQLSRRDIEQLIDNGVRSQMSTISNQVMNKIERQMRNEKMRRGY